MNALCRDCKHKEYHDVYVCGLTARDVAEYNQEQDCENFEEKGKRNGCTTMPVLRQ